MGTEPYVSLHFVGLTPTRGRLGADVSKLVGVRSLVVLACLTLGAFRAGNTASLAHRPLDVLDAHDESIGSRGLVVGMKVPEAERLVGHPIHTLDRSKVGLPPTAMLVRAGRILELGLATRDGVQVIASIRLFRMAADDPADWTTSALVQALKARLGPLRYVPSLHAPELDEKSNPTPLFALATNQRIQVLLKAEEGFVLIGTADSFD